MAATKVASSSVEPRLFASVTVPSQSTISSGAKSEITVAVTGLTADMNPICTHDGVGDPNALETNLVHVSTRVISAGNIGITYAALGGAATNPAAHIFKLICW